MGCGSSRKDIEGIHNVNENTTKPKNKTTTNDDNNNFTKKHFKVGDRVHVRGYVGTVKFVGSTELGDGSWVGLELDKPHQQGNDGFYKEAKYFSCKPKHGLFVRPEGVDFHTQELETSSLPERLSPETVVKLQCQVRKILAKIRLRNLLKRSENEKRIDKHVKNTPAEAEQSINGLSEYLTKPFESDRDKAFAIFRWLCFNVSYDVEGFFGRRSKVSCDAGDVLINKTSVCAGYANLFEALAKQAGLEIRIVNGYAKGYGYKAGQRVDGVNHAWNALKIDDQWYLSDATWGAGFLGNDLLFQRSPNTYRFLMQPDYAIYDYFPEDEKLQLLDKPLSRETFEKSAVISGPLYEMGVELLSHKESHYTIDSDVMEMDFYCPGRKIILMAKLKDSSGKAHDGQQSKFRQRTQLRRCGINQVRLHAQFPVKGDYSIDIFVNVEGTWTFGLTYYITANKGCGIDEGGFPRLSSSFYDDGFGLITPLTNIETTTGRAEIRFQCYNRRFWSLNGNVIGIDGSQKHLLKNQALSYSEKTNDGFILKVDTPAPGTYLLRIFAKSVEEGDGSPFVCEYYINNMENGKRLLTGFPYISNPLYSWGLEIVEPKENILTEDGKAVIKMKATEMCTLDVSSIRLTGNVRQDGAKINNLLPNQVLCFSETTNKSLEMQVDTPGEGLYILNIFGTSEKGENVWLCNYFIHSTEKEKREAVGFPMLSDDFHALGMKLVTPRENIFSKDGRAEISFECPENLTDVNGYIIKEKQSIHGCCKTTTNEDKTNRNISIQLPSEGLFKLNVFGKKDDGDSNVFLFCFVIFAEKGVEK